MITHPPPIEGLLQPGGLLPGKSFLSSSSSTPSEHKGRYLVGPSWGRKVEKGRIAAPAFFTLVLPMMPLSCVPLKFS